MALPTSELYLNNLSAKYELGTVAASEQVITDLYINLRRSIRQWAGVTQQTTQARMGYVGQHLVSVATGHPGGKSGARGRDLILPGGEYAEIKTCYRVDQLGKCNSCERPVASIETECHHCGSTDIKRNDDSKWLIGIHHDQEFEAILDPKYYFLVLFDFVDLDDPTTIRASIWQLDPQVPGFALCMIDYYRNIRSASISKAPFNMWPYQLKFDLMRPLLIYRSLIKEDDTIETLLFPGRDPAELHVLNPLPSYARSTNLTLDKIRDFARRIGFAGPKPENKRDFLLALHEFADRQAIAPETLADQLASALYLSDITDHLAGLPARLRKKLKLR